MSYADDVSSLGCNLMLELVAFTRFFERLPFLLETRGFPTLQRACPAQLLVRENKATSLSTSSDLILLLHKRKCQPKLAGPGFRSRASR